MTQCERIYRHLLNYGTISQLEALSEYGCMRLASRISDLRQMGIVIHKQMKKTKNRYGEPVAYAEYYLVDKRKEKEKWQKDGCSLRR